jgi:dipeptide/tripeptide permease
MWYILSVCKKIVMTIIGALLLLIGILMIFLPGPAIIVIPLAIAILGSEYLIIRSLSRQFTGYLYDRVCDEDDQGMCRLLRKMK